MIARVSSVARVYFGGFSGFRRSRKTFISARLWNRQPLVSFTSSTPRPAHSCCNSASMCLMASASITNSCSTCSAISAAPSSPSACSSCSSLSSWPASSASSGACCSAVACSCAVSAAADSSPASATRPSGCASAVPATALSLAGLTGTTASCPVLKSFFKSLTDRASCVHSSAVSRTFFASAVFIYDSCRTGWLQ